MRAVVGVRPRIPLRIEVRAGVRVLDQGDPARWVQLADAIAESELGAEAVGRFGRLPERDPCAGLSAAVEMGRAGVEQQDRGIGREPAGRFRR